MSGREQYWRKLPSHGPTARKAIRVCQDVADAYEHLGFIAYQGVGYNLGTESNMREALLEAGLLVRLTDGSTDWVVPR